LQYWEEGKSEKHINDIATIIAVSGQDLDINAVEKITLNPKLNEKFMEMMKNSPDTSD
jgi:predicted house-cleaning noncanonical NTP pyrophosphatase (MazG superfamily)